MFFTARFPATAALALAACVPSIVVGDHPQDSTASDSTPGSTTADDPTTDETPTTEAPELPAVCGDGLVGAGEPCDDGNDEPNDGCNVACQRTGRIVWSREPEGLLTVTDLEIDPAGRIVVLGWGDGTPLLLVFAPDGSELWRGPVPETQELAIDQDGRMFLAGYFSGNLHAVQFDGEDLQSLWSFAPEAPAHSFVALDVGPDAAYSIVQELGGNTEKIFVLRHDAATGAVVWQTELPAEPPANPSDLAFVDGRVVVAGSVGGDHIPFLATLDGDGALLSTHHGEDLAELWSAVTAIGGGELALVGLSSENRFVVRRLGVDDEEIWTSHLTGAPGDVPMRMATSPGELIAIVGSAPGPAPDSKRGLVRLHDATGALVWASLLASPEGTENLAMGVAFGADALYVVGQAQTSSEDGVDVHAWLHRFAVD